MRESGRDASVLSRLQRLRALARIVHRGMTGFRVEASAPFNRSVVAEAKLRAPLEAAGFRVRAVASAR